MDYLTAEDHLKAISEATRLQIISYLTLDTFCICELVELLQMSQPSISQHVRRLKEMDLINEERRGKWMFYSLNKSHHFYPLILHLVNILPSLKANVNQLVVDGKRVLCD